MRTKVDKMIAEFKKQCTTVRWVNTGDLSGGKNIKEVDYKKLSRLLIRELKRIEELYEG